MAEWKRTDRLLYTLEQIGWRKGEPVEQNRLMIRVEGGPNATNEELDDLMWRLDKFLSAEANP